MFIGTTKLMIVYAAIPPVWSSVSHLHPGLKTFVVPVSRARQGMEVVDVIARRRHIERRW